MNTILFTWNPNRWEWKNLPQDVVLVNSGGCYEDTWSCGSTKRIEPGDRAILMRLGLTPKGIMGSGTVLTRPEDGEHWDEQKRAEGLTTVRVWIRFDRLSTEPLIGERTLSEPPLSAQNWFPQASGTFIDPEVATMLETILTDITGTRTAPVRAPELPILYSEGAKRKRLITTHERRVLARNMCIEHHGTRCFVCHLSFEEVYGEIGTGFIHVHHLTPMSQIGEEYKVDPARDLCPVCPNCHAMLHRKAPPYTPSELRTILNQPNSRKPTST